MSNYETIITIFGDICPVEDTLQDFISGVPTNIMSAEILKLISESDITVGNLECSLTDNPSPIQKTGPVLHAPTASAQTLSRAGFDALSLANNHIRDCGNSGVEATIASCTDNGISVFGAGENENEAKKPFIVEKNGLRVAFLSFAEHEFNAVSPNRIGAAIFDIYDDFRRIKDIKSEVDFLVILYHGGIEYHPYPSPLLQKKCRLMAEAGANLILCQHSHCIGCYEKVGSSTILYGQGNNLFGYRKNNSGWNEGLLVQVIISSNSHKIDFIPCITGANGRLELIHGSRKKSLMEDLINRSKNIASNEFVSNEWNRFCDKAEMNHIPLLLGWNRYFIYLNRLLSGWPLRILYGKRKRNISHNLIRCESHYEVIRTILSKSDF